MGEDRKQQLAAYMATNNKANTSLNEKLLTQIGPRNHQGQPVREDRRYDNADRSDRGTGAMIDPGDRAVTSTVPSQLP
jgi:hypothetical protein